MNVCIIGGSGFIGSRLAEKLIENKHDVIIYDKNQSLFYPDKTIIGDVRDRNALIQALNNCDIIYNLAAEHRDDVTPTSLYYDVNVGGADNIVYAAEKNNISRIVFTSSVAVYGLNKPDPDEKSPTEPFNHYGKSKLAAEKVFTDWTRQDERRSLTVVRPVVVFGEGNRGNVYNLIKQIESNKFMMVGLGDNRKSMAYVGNVVEFLTRSMDFGPGSYLFNFANKPDLTVRELVDFVRAELGMTSKLSKLPYPVGLAGGLAFDLLSRLTGKKYPVSSIRIRKFCANTTVSTRALEECGFSSPYTLQEGLRRMIANLDQNIYFEGGG